jgi:hypothetical protein
VHQSCCHPQSLEIGLLRGLGKGEEEERRRRSLSTSATCCFRHVLLFFFFFFFFCCCWDARCTCEMSQVSSPFMRRATCSLYSLQTDRSDRLINRQAGLGAVVTATELSDR